MGNTGHTLSLDGARHTKRGERKQKGRTTLVAIKCRNKMMKCRIQENVCTSSLLDGRKTCQCFYPPLSLLLLLCLRLFLFFILAFIFFFVQRYTRPKLFLPLFLCFHFSFSIFSFSLHFLSLSPLCPDSCGLHPPRSSHQPRRATGEQTSPESEGEVT